MVPAMPNIEDYRRLADSGVIEEVRDELMQECFDAWRLTESADDRERVFFRQMAIDDIADAIIAKAKAKARLEVA